MKECRSFTKQTIYDLMNGLLDLEHYPVPGSELIENEFADEMPCAQLYQQVYEANQRICGRLGKNEDEDVEIIIDSLLSMMELLSMKMYDYGSAQFFLSDRLEKLTH